MLNTCFALVCIIAVAIAFHLLRRAFRRRHAFDQVWALCIMSLMASRTRTQASQRIIDICRLQVTFTEHGLVDGPDGDWFDEWVGAALEAIESRKWTDLGLLIDQIIRRHL